MGKSRGAECFVYVFKDGALAAVGHDLKLKVGRFELEVHEDRSVTATAELSSIQVLGAMKNGQLQASGLSASDKADIEKSIQTKVLETSRHPQAAFRSTAVEETSNSYDVKGFLKLHGVEERVRCVVTKNGAELVGELQLDQTTFKIKPFKALLGALKIKPTVTIEVRTRLPEGEA